MFFLSAGCSGIRIAYSSCKDVFLDFLLCLLFLNLLSLLHFAFLSFNSASNDVPIVPFRHLHTKIICDRCPDLQMYPSDLKLSDSFMEGEYATNITCSWWSVPI